MDSPTRQLSIQELKEKNRLLTLATLASSICSLLLCGKLFLQSEIIIEKTAGMPSGSVIQKGAWDKKAELATLLDVTCAISNINPANKDYQKQLIQVFLSPKSYTRIAAEIDERAKKLEEQRELGSYYFIWKEWSYDDKLDKFFIRGDVHTVNAAHDSPEPWVFEYSAHVENYRLVVDEVSSYRGDRPHDSAWLKEQKQ